MRVSDLLDSRRSNWEELARLCARLEGEWRLKAPAQAVSRFASLYRSACADLALADAYQLPPATIHYLHELVGRAHNQLYQSRTFRLRTWFRELFVHVPRRLYSDGCLRLALVIFWGVFLASVGLGWSSPDFAEQIAGKEQLVDTEESFSHGVSGRDPDASGLMAGFYILHNPSIGLRVFAFGLLFGIGGLFETVLNAAMIGAIFGHMIHSPQRDNFFEFVTAHGPFELTGIVVMAAAGMRLGFSLVRTHGRRRSDSLRRAAQQSVPIMWTGVLLFCLAALIEGFVSPSSAPYAVKAGVAVLSTLMLLFYFVGLGYPGERHAA